MPTYKTSGSLTTATKTADGEAVEITTDATVPTNTSISLTVKQDESGGSVADTTQTVSVSDGITTTPLSSFAFANGSSWWLDIELSTSDDSSTPTFNSATLTVQSLEAPSNLIFTDTQTEDELILDWDTVSEATGYYVYRAEASGNTKSDYTQVADVSSPPYTDAGLEDGERYYYRVSSHD